MLLAENIVIKSKNITLDKDKKFQFLKMMFRSLRRIIKLLKVIMLNMIKKMVLLN